MGLRDEERRQLAEIERRLGEDDPRLDRRLATLRPGTSRTLWTVVGLIGLVVGGGVVIALGAGAGAPVVVAIGVIVAAGVPTAVIWRRWLRKLGNGIGDGSDDAAGTPGNRSGNGKGDSGRPGDGPGADSGPTD
ncbi:Protein of unknown function (DUF3040) [Prauserella aidingensis]|uniref:DUF3040 domain-containing protein n=1 Tax=Prauserella aidingensis TaxID=387890 RepID=UPI0020A362C8|nr:DUF3040 domain-containing protein [Prauserella aidingensis]MCP2253336.1 Protein of unknown function (DUF3040) [Prauserella aidingensis]